MSLQNEVCPVSMEEFCGNDSLKDEVEAYLKRKNRNRSILITGNSGCGKTTLGRIIAKELGAVEFDYIEQNASDFKGVDNIRAIRRQMISSPIYGKVKVYLLDECHKLTSDAQEAMLKIIGEPPAHVYFILCTTEPEKLKITVKRRCTPFSVKDLSEITVAKYLLKISTERKHGIEKEVIKKIAQLSSGSIGIALMMMDKVVGMDSKKALDSVETIVTEYNDSISLCRSLMKEGAKWKEVSGILQGLRGTEPESIRRAVLGYCASVTLNNPSERCYKVLSAFSDTFFNSGFGGLVKACFEVIFVE